MAKELGISADSLRSWLKAAGVSMGEANRSNKDAKRVRELEAQARELKKQVTDKDATIDVLKKSSVCLPRKHVLRPPAFLPVHVGILSKP